MATQRNPIPCLHREFIGIDGTPVKIIVRYCFGVFNNYYVITIYKWATWGSHSPRFEYFGSYVRPTAEAMVNAFLLYIELHTTGRNYFRENLHDKIHNSESSY